MPDVHPEDFKAALGSWCAGVTVVTTRQDDLVYGITVSSFTSLSLDPRLILVCLADSNRLPRMIEQTQRFAVSILAEGQEQVSSYFAVSGREPVPAFEEFGTIEWYTGSPIIDGALAHLDCELHEAIHAGDHTIIIGHVLGAATQPEQKPLLYFRRAYRTVTTE
jgi:flavin reductase (DIM6/NTAB) family NADH-FMN oxidoreductase RutF